MFCSFAVVKHSLSSSLNIKVVPHLSKIFIIICFNDSPSKMVKNAFYFILKALFVLKIFKFLSWLFGHVGKTAWLERSDEFWNLGRHNVVRKQLQWIYCPISHEVKATRQWSLVNWKNITREIFFFEKYAENKAGKLVPDHLFFFKTALY